MKRIRVLNLIIVFIGLMVVVSCSKKIYHNNPYILSKSTTSKINKFERQFSRDTSLGNFSGVITRRDSSMYGVDTIPAFLAMVLSFDSITKKVKGIDCDFDGYYSLYVNPGNYQFEVRHPMNNRLIIKNIEIEAGEKIIIDALLGDRTDSTIFEIKDPLMLINTYNPK